MTVNEIYCKGNSMVPTILPGDILEVDASAVPMVGDVIVFNTPILEKYVHRLVKKKGSEITTRGDNIRAIDNFRITNTDIIGVVHSIKRNNSHLKVHGGKVGLLLGRYRNIQKMYRQSYVRPILFLFHIKPVRYLISILGDILLKNRVSLINGEKEYIKIFYKKHRLGCYCKKSKQFFIRPVMQPLFSTTTLQNIVQKIES